MSARRNDEDINRLYQLPLDEFTSARNALAKGAGPAAADIRELAKPSVPAWAVNQLYWQRRSIYDALLDAAEELRRAHAAVLAGRGGDVRAAGKQHEGRLEAGVKAALSILADSGHRATDATRQALVTTLRALPSEEPAGRLTRTLQPGGFEMLAGLSIGGRVAAPRAATVGRVAAPEPTGAAPSKKATVTLEKKAPARAADVKALAKAREASAAAVRALRQAEHTAQREEFESARTLREVEKTAKALERAREAVADAERERQDREQEAAAAVRARDAAERRAERAEQAVEAARARADSARRDVEKK